VRDTKNYTGPKPVEYLNTFQRVRDDSGRKVIREIIRESRNNNTVSIWRFDFSDTSPTTKCLNFSRTIQTTSGAEIFSEYAAFDDPFLNYPDNIAHAMALPFLLSGMDRRKGSKRDIYIWAQDAKPSHLFAVVIGEEKIRIMGKTRSAWVVRIKIDKKDVIEPWGALGNIIARLIPEFSFWYDIAPPHRMLRAKSDFGPYVPGAPLFYQELVEIK
jgi:hypothetical protein